jgi:hypothetical protein
VRDPLGEAIRFGLRAKIAGKKDHASDMVIVERQVIASGFYRLRFSRVPSMFDSLGVQVPCTT